MVVIKHKYTGETLLEIESLTGAYLYRANLYRANLVGANLPHFQICPEEGAFYAYKKLSQGVLVKVEIPAYAKRTNSLTGRKCRASALKVVEVLENPHNLPLDEANPIKSTHHGEAAYYLGAGIEEPGYDDDIRVECTKGLHFFMTKREAQKWA